MCVYVCILDMSGKVRPQVFVFMVRAECKRVQGKILCVLHFRLCRLCFDKTTQGAGASGSMTSHPAGEMPSMSSQ